VRSSVGASGLWRLVAAGQGSGGEEDRRLGAEGGGDSLNGEGSQEGEDAGLEASGSWEL